MFALWIVLGFGIGIFIVSLAAARMVLAECRLRRLVPPAPSTPGHRTAA